MVLLQLKDPLELLVKRREFLPGSGGQLHQRDSRSNSGSSLNLIVYNNSIYCC